MGPNDIVKMGRENVNSGPEEEFLYSHESGVGEECNSLEPVAAVTISDVSALNFFIEDSFQLDVIVPNEESPVQNTVAMQQYQAVSIKSTNEIAKDPLEISPSKNNSSSDNSEILRSVLLTEEVRIPVLQSSTTNSGLIFLNTSQCSGKDVNEVYEMGNKCDGSAMTGVLSPLNTGILHCGHPMWGACAARRGRGARGCGARGCGARGPGARGCWARGRGARGCGARQAKKKYPAQNPNTFPLPAPAYVSLPEGSAPLASPLQLPMKTSLSKPLPTLLPFVSGAACSSPPAHPLPRAVNAPLPKPLPEPPDGVDFLMVRRHLDDVLQKIITKVTKSGRKRNHTSTPLAATANIDVEAPSESANKRVKPPHPLAPVVEVNANTADATIICSVREQQHLVERDPTLQSVPDKNISSMRKQVSTPPSTSGNMEIKRLCDKLRKSLNKSSQVSVPVVEVNANSTSETANRAGKRRDSAPCLTPRTGSKSRLVNDEATVDSGGGSCQTVVSNSYPRPLNTVRDMLLLEQNFDQLTPDVSENTTPAKCDVDEHSRCSFPPFIFTKRIIKQVSPKTSSIVTMPSLQSTLTTETASLALEQRVSAPALVAGSALPHFTTEDSKLEISREYNGMATPRRRRSERTQLQSEWRGHDSTPATNTARNSSAISSDTRCVGDGMSVGELREKNPEAAAPSSMVAESAVDSQSTTPSPTVSLPLEDPLRGVARDVFPFCLEDTESLLSSNSLLPPGNYVTPTKPKLIPPWRRRSNDTTKLRSEPRNDGGTRVKCSTGSTGEVPSEAQCCGGEGTSKKRSKVRDSRPNASAPICDICGRGFSSFCHLTSHVRLHTAAARCFFCSLCKQRFLHFDALASHARRRHDVKLFTTAPKGNGKAATVLQRPFAYSCSVCSEVFAGRSTLVNHLLSQHSAPSGEAVDHVAPALLAGTRMRGTAPCTRLGSSNTRASVQSSSETLQPNTSSDFATKFLSNAHDQSSKRFQTNASQGGVCTLRRSPSPITVCSRSSSPFSSRSTVSPPVSPLHSVLSVNSVSEISQESINYNMSSAVNLSSNSHLRATKKYTQSSFKLVSPNSSNCPIHSSSGTRTKRSTSINVLSASRNNSNPTSKSCAKEKPAISVNVPPSSVKNGCVSVNNSNEEKDIMDSSSGKVSSHKSSVQPTQKVRTPCPVHSSLRSYSSKYKTSGTNSCPVHKPDRTPFSDNSDCGSLRKEESKDAVEQKRNLPTSRTLKSTPYVVIPKLSCNSPVFRNICHEYSPLVSPSKRKLKPSFPQSHSPSNTSSPQIQKKKKSSHLHSNPTTSSRITKCIKKSKPHCPKYYPKANVPRDLTSSSLRPSSSTSSGQDLNSSFLAGEHCDPVVKQTEDIESITVE